MEERDRQRFLRFAVEQANQRIRALDIRAGMLICLYAGMFLAAEWAKLAWLEREALRAMPIGWDVAFAASSAVHVALAAAGFRCAWKTLRPESLWKKQMTLRTMKSEAYLLEPEKGNTTYLEYAARWERLDEQALLENYQKAHLSALQLEVIKSAYMRPAARLIVWTAGWNGLAVVVLLALEWKFRLGF